MADLDKWAERIEQAAASSHFDGNAGRMVCRAVRPILAELMQEVRREALSCDFCGNPIDGEPGKLACRRCIERAFRQPADTPTQETGSPCTRHEDFWSQSSNCPACGMWRDGTYGCTP